VKSINFPILLAFHISELRHRPTSRLRSGFSIANQIKFDLRFTDLRSTWCSELIVVVPWIFDLELRDRRLADPPSTEPTDWLTVTLDLLSTCLTLASVLGWKHLLSKSLPLQVVFLSCARTKLQRLSTVEKLHNSAH